jgi:hypothetical protein
MVSTCKSMTFNNVYKNKIKINLFLFNILKQEAEIIQGVVGIKFF